MSAADSAAADASFRARQIAAFAAVYLIWGSTFLGIRYAIETLPGFSMAAVRFTVVGLGMIAWGRLRGEAWPAPRQWRSALLLGTLLLAFGNGGVVFAEQRLPTGLTALLVATEPVWVAILVWLSPRGDRPTARTTLGVLLGFAGALLLTAPSRLAGEAVHLPSALVVFFASLCWASGSVYASRADLPRSLAMSAGSQMFSGGLVLALLGALAGEWQQLDPEKVSLASLLALGYLIIFGSLIGFSAYSWLVRTTAPNLVATYAFVNPLVAVFLGWLLAGEPITGRTVAAAALIVLSVMLVSLRPGSRPARPRRRRASPPAEAVPPPSAEAA